MVLTGLSLLLAITLQAHAPMSANMGDITLEADLSFLSAATGSGFRDQWQWADDRIFSHDFSGRFFQSEAALSPDVRSGQAVGLAIEVRRDTPDPGMTGWRFVAGFENERLEISPAARGIVQLYRGGTLSVVDGYAGLATDITNRGTFTLGYVRQERRARAGAREWADDGHFIGMAWQTSW